MNDILAGTVVVCWIDTARVEDSILGYGKPHTLNIIQFISDDSSVCNNSWYHVIYNAEHVITFLNARHDRRYPILPAH